jgi:NAD(P)-dependent dehydrogenase (short-subunit alcohol dehydrogenase family)
MSVRNYPDLLGKVAVITGAGRRAGLGAAIARRLAEEGCRIVIADLAANATDANSDPNFPASALSSTEEMEEIAAEIRAIGVDVLTVPCDMRSELQIKNLIARTCGSFGRLDILVNNAGIGYLMKPILDMELSEFDAVMDVNLRGVWIASKYAAEAMVKQGDGGRVINIASQAAKSGFPFASAYCASKHGLVGLTRVCAIEWGKYGINANAICPNHVTTGLGAWQNEYFAKALGLSLDAYLQAMKDRIPLGRPGLQSDTANAAAFLASEQSVYVTGEALNVSGGEEYH